MPIVLLDTNVLLPLSDGASAEQSVAEHARGTRGLQIALAWRSSLYHGTKYHRVLGCSDSPTRRQWSGVEYTASGVTQITEDHQRILHNGRKVHHGRHNGSLLSRVRTLRMPGLAAHYTRCCLLCKTSVIY